jgi:hypothetical protein
MTEARRDPEPGGRSLAEILREAGLESPTRGRRRRWDDENDTGIRQRQADSEEDTGRIGGRPYGRRAGDLRIAAPQPDGPDAASGRDGHGPDAVVAAEPTTAAIPGLRPSGKPDVPGAAPSAGTGTDRDRRPDDQREGDPPGRERRPRDRRPLEARPDRRAADRRSAPPADDAPSTGPIPVVTDDSDQADDLEATPKESALAWLRFGGELVIALAAGVGIYFLFTVIWEMLPYLAVLVAPLAVTGLVAGVGAYRHKMSRGPVGPKLLAVLVFAGTLLTVAPAAGLLAAG